jgi:hypothetical protein
MLSKLSLSYQIWANYTLPKAVLYDNPRRTIGWARDTYRQWRSEVEWHLDPTSQVR